MVRGETERASRSISGVAGRTLIFFSSWVVLHDTRPTDNRQGTPVSKGEKDFCVGVSRAH